MPYYPPPSTSGGGGGPTLLDEVELGSDAATVTFSSISQDYRMLEIHFVARSSLATASKYADFMLVELNADSNGGNYYQNGTEVRFGKADPRTITSGYNQIAFVPGANAATGRWGTGIIRFPFYSETGVTNHACGDCYSPTQFNDENPASLKIDVLHVASPAALTQVRFSLDSAGEYLTGSRFLLFGIE